MAKQRFRTMYIDASSDQQVVAFTYYWSCDQTGRFLVQSASWKIMKDAASLGPVWSSMNVGYCAKLSNMSFYLLIQSHVPLLPLLMPKTILAFDEVLVILLVASV